MDGLSGVMGKLARPKKCPVGGNAHQADQAAVELDTAKEILAEVFSIRLSEVDNMILSRSKEGYSLPPRSKEERLWPQEFQLDS